MNRKEYYEYIKTHNLKEEATKLARSIYGDNPRVNWTNLNDEQLNQVVSQYIVDINKTQLAKYNNIPSKCNHISKCTDEGARKAILAIAKILNLKNIERNFN